MRVFNQRIGTILLCTTAVLVAAATCRAKAAGAKPAESEGIQKLTLSSFYDGQPVTVDPSAGGYELPLAFEGIVNANRVQQALGLDDNAVEAIERNGFVVVRPPGLWPDRDSMVTPYEMFRQEGIPNFVTSDSLLHLYHVQFDEILRAVEENEFSGKLVVMSGALFEESLGQYESFSGDLKEAARRNVAYFAVAMKLLGEEIVVPEYVSGAVDSELAAIEAHAGFSPSAIFVYLEDYSQYVPRGHYTRSEALQKYFRAMMWYGRMSFLLKGSEFWGPMGEALISIEDARIQTMQGSLIALALDSLQSESVSIADIWNRIYAVTAFFVGLADDLTPYEYKEAILKVFGDPVDVEDFNNEEKMFALKAELALLRSPKIYGGTGQIWVMPPLTPEKLDEVLEKTKGMRLMGQRFIPDSYMFQRLVAPVVGDYLGNGAPFTLGSGLSARCFPRGLDVMAVLGSEQALAILDREGDTEYEGYDESMNELIDIFESFSEAAWNRNLYWSWLYTLKGLLGNWGQGYPAFMQRDAWKDKELNAALASWTELRHDTILYAKQSYTPVIGIPQQPERGYVEPVPEFLNRLLALTRMTRTGLSDMEVLSPIQESRLAAFEAILDRLLGVAIAELEGEILSTEDYLYIHHFADVLQALLEGLPDKDNPKTTLVADVHTDTNSSQVVEEGVGYVRFLVVAHTVPQGPIVLGAGPVFSYYEFKWPMNDRLTDEKWIEILEEGTTPPEPTWVRSFVHPVTLPVTNEDDTDDDELPDAWEKSMWGGIAEVNDPDGDWDKDGRSNQEEYRAGTDPRDPNSAFRVLGIAAGESGLGFTWSTVAGNRYRVLYSDNLATWRPLGSPITAGAEITEFSDATIPQPTHRFYKVDIVR
jgi:hypothetical protein